MIDRIKNFKIKINGDKIIWMVFLLLMAISCLEVYSTLGKTVYEIGRASCRERV